MLASPEYVPSILEFGFNSYGPLFQFGVHSYESELEIIHVTEGSFFMVINEQCTKLKKGDSIIIYPKANRSMYLKKNEKCRTTDIVFRVGDPIDDSRSSDMVKALSFLNGYRQKNGFLKFTGNVDINHTTEKIARSFSKKGIDSEEVLKMYFCELYLQLSLVIDESLLGIGSTKDDRVLKAFEFIINNYGKETTPESISKFAGLSQRHLARLFIKETGMSVQDYLTLFRLEKAKELLRNTDMDITGIAFEIGFSSSQYFTTCFKKYMNITPFKYRTAHLA